MKLIDTHCHIHDPEFFSPEQTEEALAHAREELEALLLIGTSLEDSKNAVAFAHKHPDICWAAVGIHPHEASTMSAEQIADDLAQLDQLAGDAKVVAIGECGFDFYYNKREDALDRQTQLLKGQLKIANKHNLPLSFHVRDAFSDFWPVFDEYHDLRGVLHSFTDTQEHADKALARGLLFGVNGIATFTKQEWQREVYRMIPLETLLIETDAPFLTPNPIRGTINEPRNVTYITNFLAELRGDTTESIRHSTTSNARGLFRFS